MSPLQTRNSRLVPVATLILICSLCQPGIAQENGGFADSFESEINVDKVMESLQQRKQELDEREERLDEREEQLARLRRDVNEQINRLEGLRAAIEDLVGQIDETRKQKLDQLASMYESMKSKQAAAVMTKLDPREAADILGAMKERSAGGILEAMGKIDPAQGARISQALKNMPGLDDVQDQLGGN